MLPVPASGTTSRRSVVRGAAWAVPAIVVASAAPATAMSPAPPRGPLQFEGPGCTAIGAGVWYFFALTVRQDIDPEPIPFTFEFSTTQLTHHGQRPLPEGPNAIHFHPLANIPPRVTINFSALEEVSEGTLVLRYTHGGATHEISVHSVFDVGCLDRGIRPWFPPV